MLEVSLVRSRNGALSRKGCVVNVGLNVYGKQHICTPPPPSSLTTVRFTSGNPNAALPAPATTFGGIESAQAAAQAAVAALGVVSTARPTTTLRLNNMLTAGDLEDESGLGDIEEETKVCVCACVFFVVLRLLSTLAGSRWRVRYCSRGRWGFIFITACVVVMEFNN